MKEKEYPLYVALALILLLFVLGAFFWDGTDLFARTVQLQTLPARLINDYAASAGAGPAMLNAAIVAAIGLLLVRVAGIRLSGPTIAGVLTMLGFGLFGKTVFNILPILLGVYLSARIASKTYGEYILIALFGTALGPLVTVIAFEIGAGIAAILLSVIGGLIVGFLLPPVAIAMLRLHQGYSLYNIGLTVGFLGVFLAAFLRLGGAPLPGVLFWESEPQLPLTLIIPASSLVLLLFGLGMGKKQSLTDLLRIMKVPGRLPSDFMDIVSNGGGFVNMGLLGLASWAYILLVGAPQNGPVIGGALTVIGFGAFGKHLRNCWPLVAGVAAATLLSGHQLTDPGPILAALFVTTLAPIPGTFGPIAGIVAGIVHFALVMQTGGWHGGMALYNNGFAGGLTATFLLAIIEWYQSTHDKTLNRWKKESR